ncbi:hypothetical protein BHM03_00011223 [Ensete ventricosum]|nr:hypothetical protein BHM03_00011223 [Ensete ventricosum]
MARVYCSSHQHTCTFSWRRREPPSVDCHRFLTPTPQVCDPRKRDRTSGPCFATRSLEVAGADVTGKDPLNQTPGRERCRSHQRYERHIPHLRSDRLPSSSSCSRLPPLRFPWRGGEKQRLAGCQGRKKVAAAASDATVVLPDTKQKPSSEEGMEIAHLSTLITKLADAARRLQNPSKQAVWVKNWRTVAEILVEKVHLTNPLPFLLHQTHACLPQGVTGCRSFTLIAVAGSLIGSILCFVEVTI